MDSKEPQTLNHRPLRDQLLGDLVVSNEDRDLAIRAQQRDVVAFEALVKKYGSRVYSIAYRMVGNVEDAKDISQEAFIRLYKSINKYNPKHSLLSWLSRIAVNVSIDFKRQKTRRHQFWLKNVSKDDKYRFLSHSKTPDQLLADKEFREIMNDLLNCLTAKERAVFVLRDLEEFPGKEVARVLSCSSGTVRCHLHHARTKIKDKMLKFYPELIPPKSGKK